MTRRIIAATIVAAMLGLPLLAGCESHHKDKDEATLKVDTEGSNTRVMVKTD
jgi:hypothetical protein